MIDRMLLKVDKVIKMERVCLVVLLKIFLKSEVVIRCWVVRILFLGMVVK